MGLSGTNSNDQALREANATPPPTLSFMNAPDLMGGHGETGQTYADPRAIPQAPVDKPLSKGQRLAGILADALSGLAGNTGQGPFAAMQERRRAQQDAEVQWSRRQQAEDQQWLHRQQYQDAHPNPTDFERMLQASGVQPGTPAWTQAMGKRVERQLEEPDIVVPLQDGRMYVGPRSGLSAAITGAVSSPAPVGKLQPYGGPTPPASGTFR